MNRQRRDFFDQRSSIGRQLHYYAVVVKEHLLIALAAQRFEFAKAFLCNRSIL